MTEDRDRNVFVLGLDEFQRGELGTIEDAARLRFHGLLAPEVVTRPDEHGFGPLLAQARDALDAFDGSVDALIAHWDFPTSVLVPILARERGLTAPTLEAVLACEHKLWSRIEQAASVPEVVPEFQGFDPFEDDPFATIALDLPIWIKPVKSHSSQLGFLIEDRDQFEEALPLLRDGIGALGEPFNEVLAMAELPADITATSGLTCVAETIMAGRQVTVEGSVASGVFAVHGVVDSPKDEHGNHFSRYEYPATGVPQGVQERMIDVCVRYLRHIGFDDGCWNIEFMWDDDAHQLWLVEVNSRISQSHADLFAKVDGASNHQVAVDVALGRAPRMPHREGEAAVAAKCFLWTEELADGIVRRVPGDEDLAEVERRFPGTIVDIAVAVGDQLSQLRDQSSYRYDLGTVFLGAADRDELLDRFATCRELLTFEIDAVDGSEGGEG
jgi:biotin carboxylase